MKNKIFINTASIICVIVSLFSCKKVLDRPFDVEIKDSDVFGNITYTTDFVTDIYSALPNGYTEFASTFSETATDDARHANLANQSTLFNTDSWGFNLNPDDQYGRYYNAIRKCNVFFSRANEVKLIDHTTVIKINGNDALAQRERLKGEVFFLRAYFYTELIKRYGGVPIVDKILNPGDDINLPRNTYDEVVKRISDDCDSAFSKLPTTYNVTIGGVNNANYYGRATKWTALALKSRVYLYAASPLQNANNDPAKWIAAYTTVKPFFDGASITPAMILNNGIAGYEALFRGNSSAISEIIWARPSANNNTLEANNYPVGFDGGNGGVNPSQSLVDAYEMTNGKAITEIGSGYNLLTPYTGRDPRLAATILFNNVTFKGRPIETFDGGLDGPQKINGTLTGYYMKKHIDANLNLTTGQTSQHNYIYFRLAEMLLNYAEAKNEADGAVSDVYTAVNRVRARVNMPALPAGLTKEQMRVRIRNERRVELAFEGHRYWDARRWNIAKDVFNGPFYGMKVVKTGVNTFTYSPYQIETRVFKEYMNLYPFQQREIFANPNLKQNPGWIK